MKKILFTILSVVATGVGYAQDRFPKPDFESGYQYPDVHYQLTNEGLWSIIDIVLLVAMMSMVAYAALKGRNRKPIIWTSITSIAYFGFFRSGCVCSIGSIQNVALAFADASYVLPLSVLLIFILPIIFALLFGRVFCGGACPFGALQDMINIKNYQLAKSVSAVLGMIPWIYLIFTILYAVTRTSFIVCQFDPFIGIFRLGGDIGLIIFGAILLIASIFTGRPFCRFLCPYGALLSLFSRVSFFKIVLTKKSCINCELCHNACGVDAIKPPYDNKVKETRLQGVKRIINYFVLLPVIVAASALLMRLSSEALSQSNKVVRLYEMVMAYEAEPQPQLTLELEAFYGQGGTVEDITARYQVVQAEFKLYSTIAGGLIGLVIALTLINLSVKRTRKEYEIDHAACVDCGRCFGYCPQNKSLINKKKLHKSIQQ